MGTADLRDAFNAVAEPRYTCQRATLAYEPGDTVQWQRLEFSGIGSDGVAFMYQSNRLRPGSDVNAAARETAQRLLDQKEPLS